MKHISHRLYDLLGTLTKAEKRKFKRFVKSRYNNSTYELLFDFIYASGFPKNRVLTKAFPEINLVRSKEYLFEMVLESLVKLGSSREILEKAKLLIKKGQQCDYLLFRTEKLAKREENYPILLEIANCYQDMGKPFLPLMKESLRFMENIAQLETLQRQIHQLALSYFAHRKEEDLQQMKNLVSQLNEPLTTKSKVAFYRSHSLYEQTTKNWENVVQVNQQIVQVLKTNGQFGLWLYTNWAKALTNQMIGCFELGQHAKCNDVVLELENLPTDYLQVNKIVEQSRFRHYLNKIDVFNEYHGIDQRIEWLESQRQFDDNKAIYYLAYARYLFCGGFYKESLTYLTEPYEHLIHKTTAKLIRLICLYEIGDFEQTYSFSEKTRQFFIRNKVNGLDRKVLLAIKRASMKPEKLKNILSGIDLTSSRFSLLKLEEWIEAKLSEQDILKVILRKVA